MGYRAAQRVPRTARLLLVDRNDIRPPNARGEIERLRPDDYDRLARLGRRAGPQNVRDHRPTGKRMERLRQRRTHARALARGQHNQGHIPLCVGGRRRLGHVAHSCQRPESPARAVAARSGEVATRSRCIEASTGADPFPKGWRARIRTWNKGSKDPCDTISPLATVISTTGCYAPPERRVKQPSPPPHQSSGQRSSRPGLQFDIGSC